MRLEENTKLQKKIIIVINKYIKSLIPKDYVEKYIIFISTNINMFFLMIQLIVDSIVLTQEDSIKYIEFKLVEKFDNFSQFIANKEILKPDYWGDCIINETEVDFYQWLMKTAKRLLKP